MKQAHAARCHHSGAGLGKGLCKGQCASRLEVGCALSFPKTDPEDVVWLFWASEKSSVRGMFCRAAPKPHGHLAGINVELRIVIQDALSEVLKVNAPMTVNVFVDDMTVSMEVKNCELSRIALTVLEKIRSEVGKKGLKLSVGKGGKSEALASCRYGGQCMDLRTRTKNICSRKRRRGEGNVT